MNLKSMQDRYILSSKGGFDLILIQSQFLLGFKAQIGICHQREKHRLK